MHEQRARLRAHGQPAAAGEQQAQVDGRLQRVAVRLADRLPARAQHGAQQRHGLVVATERAEGEGVIVGGCEGGGVRGAQHPPRERLRALKERGGRGRLAALSVGGPHHADNQQAVRRREKGQRGGRGSHAALA